MHKLTKWGLSLAGAGLLVMGGTWAVLGSRVEDLTTFSFGFPDSGNPWQDVKASYGAKEKVTSLDLETATGTVTIRQGKTFEIQTNGIKRAGSGEEDGHWTEFHTENGLAVFRTGQEGWQTVNGEEARIQVTIPETVKTVNVSVSMGSLSCHDLNLDTADLSVNMGDCDFQGRVSRSLAASVDMGNGSLDLQMPQARLDLSVDMGELTLNGREAEHEFMTSAVKTGNEGPAVTASVNMGNLNVSLQDKSRS